MTIPRVVTAVLFTVLVALATTGILFVLGVHEIIIPVMNAATLPMSQSDYSAEGSSAPFAPAEPIPRQDIGPKGNYFAADEWAALARVADRTNDTDDLADDGLPILLQRVNYIEWRDVKPVAVSDLLAHPANYRGRPVRLVIRYADNTVYRPAKRAWAGDLVKSLGFCSGEAGGPDQPVLVINKGELCDRSQGQPWEVIGYFYRIQRTPARGSGKLIDVPVIVAGSWNELVPVTAWYDTIFFWATVALSAVAAGCVVWRRRAAMKRPVVRFPVSPV